MTELFNAFDANSSYLQDFKVSTTKSVWAEGGVDDSRAWC